MMLRTHRSGYRLLFAGLIILGALNWALPAWQPWLGLISLGFWLLIWQFFRNPLRPIPWPGPERLYAPADGTVVVIEPCLETEYFKAEKIQVSIFMSPLNVHVNRAPVAGQIAYVQHHPGKYLVAWHPKSSLENERTTLVIRAERGEVLLRQIAGAVARRILHYVQPGQEVTQGEEIGFIKFGSRVDVFLPLDAQIKVEIGQKVAGNRTVLAEW